MALSDKNIIITPNIGQSADPKIVFSGADANTSAQNITLQVYPTNSGTLSFEGSSGQLFSINNNLTGSIFSVNDISGIPSIEVLDNGLLKLNEYSGNVAIGFSTDPGYKLGVNGSLSANSVSSTGTITTTGEVISTSANQFRAVQGNFGAFLRNDGSNVYLLQTANGSPYGTFNSFRPFSWNLNTGEVYIASNGNTAWFGGSVNILDNKTINVGTGNDLYLVHDGTNSSITNQTGNFSITNSSLTGNLVLQANSASGANFELTPTAAFLDSATTTLRSQNGGTTYLVVSSAGATISTGSFNGSGAGLTTINASNLSSGTVATDRLGSGTANANTVLYGDNTWKSIISGASISNDVTTNNSYYPIWSTTISGTPTTVYTSNSKLYFNPSTGTLNATIFNSLSDENQKTEIKIISSAQDIVNQINGVEFVWKDNGKRSAGVIAQELEKVLPNLVDTNENSIKSVNYNGIIAYLIQTVKELDNRIKMLENK